MAWEATGGSRQAAGAAAGKQSGRLTSARAGTSAAACAPAQATRRRRAGRAGWWGRAGGAQPRRRRQLAGDVNSHAGVVASSEGCQDGVARGQACSEDLQQRQARFAKAWSGRGCCDRCTRWCCIAGGCCYRCHCRCATASAVPSLPLLLRCCRVAHTSSSGFLSFFSQ
jgi:hypothetical protein